MAADVVGYSRLMGRDEAGTLARLKEHRAQRLEPALFRNGGRLVKLTGDGALAEFGSAVDALRAAIEFQQAVADANVSEPEASRIIFRVGLHLGDMIVDGDDLYGDGVNVAARLEAEAPPGGIVISGNVHDAVAGRLDTLFKDLGHLSLKNIERPVRAFRVQAKGDSAGQAATSEHIAGGIALSLPDKPSIAVLPFQNVSGDPEQEYFADGMVEEIITALSRTKVLFVIARNSSFSYKGRSLDVRTVGRELGVRYVLEGSVRKAGTRLRITGQLIDAQFGTHLWADRFDGELADVFALQDEITSRVVAAIVPALQQAEFQLTTVKPTESLAAYDCVLRAWAGIDRLSFDENQRALIFAERAIELDSNFALAWAAAGACYIQRKAWKWDGDAIKERREAERLLRRALELDRDDPRVLTVAGFGLGYLVGAKEEALALLERATELDANYFMAWLQRGQACQRLGLPFMPYLERALRLNPRDLRAPFAQNSLAHAYLFSGQYAEAVRLAEEALKRLPGYPPSMLTLAAARAHAGQLDAARQTVALLLKTRPGARISTMVDQMMFPESLRLFSEGLRMAGVPE
jgi:adenylate cyclase